MEELARLFGINQEAIQIGTSIGISVFPQTAQELEELFDQADLALYQAKADGRFRPISSIPRKWTKPRIVAGSNPGRVAS